MNSPFSPQIARSPLADPLCSELEAAAGSMTFSALAADPGLAAFSIFRTGSFRILGLATVSPVWEVSQNSTLYYSWASQPQSAREGSEAPPSPHRLMKIKRKKI